ncbi:hypothetical protein DM02DRAFT_633054 [Periconia macrospinosa]|uniref:Uncharacterized protein n=1 Tax=Periconia macrospinosa TaxID=97972 RepID=A0A2V1DDH4_9PLEO|nr:hypothetical protein DM02DRAFT_633054 [Periconia macrospinosa]
MATEEETSLVVLIQSLNSAILASISELVPALQDNTQASQLREESQRLQIWSNNLGIEKGGLEERLRGEQELEYSIVTLHIMIAQGLITAAAHFIEKCTSDRIKSPPVTGALSEASHTPLQLAVTTLEKQYPQFTDNFSATTISSRAQSLSRGNGTTSVASDASRNDTVDELDESLAEISATIDRLLRLTPFLEQYLHESDEYWAYLPRLDI